MKIAIKETQDGQKYFDLSLSQFIKEIIASLHFSNAIKSAFNDIDDLTEMLTDLSLNNAATIEKIDSGNSLNNMQINQLLVKVEHLKKSNENQNIILLSLEIIIAMSIMFFSFKYFISSLFEC